MFVGLVHHVGGRLGRDVAAAAENGDEDAGDVFESVRMRQVRMQV